MEILVLILTIAAIDFLSILTPGQDFAIVTRNTLKYSKTIGIYTVFGIGFITLCHCLLAMTGLSIIITKNPNLMAGIKTIGALYLIYLGTNFFKNAKNLDIGSESGLLIKNDSPENSKKQSPNPKVRTQDSISPKKAFQTGAIANLFNIEPIMAFVSIFAIILPPETQTSTKLIICVLLPLNTILWLCFITHIFSVKKVQYFLAHRMKECEQIIGIILIFFGSKTLIEHKNN